MRRLTCRRPFGCLLITSCLLTLMGLLLRHIVQTNNEKNELPWLPVRKVETIAEQPQARENVRSTQRQIAVQAKKAKDENVVTPKPTEAGYMNLNALDRDKALVLGHRRKDKGLLTIGVTTAERQNASYLDATLRSLIENADASERSLLRLVVFACDYHERGRQEAQAVVSAYSEHIQSGLLQFIVAPRSFYPKFSNLKRTYGDPEERVQWRSKENIDSVFLFAYCAGMSEYFLQMDDDLATSPGYFQTIRSFIKGHSEDDWALLDIGSTGSGKLFRDEDVLPMAQFMVQFWQEDPVDYLFLFFKALRVQKERFVVKPPLFKHLGVVSTLDLKNRERKAKEAAKAKKGGPSLRV